jgi:hypothetical protein
MKLGVISGFYPGRRFNSYINHSIYCALHGYYYVDASFPGRHVKPYFWKLERILRYLDLFDWIFWLDDDAYFTDFSKPLHEFVSDAETCELVICRSPSTKQLFTKISSGQFFLRNTPTSRHFLRLALEVDVDALKDSFWSPDLGFFSGGDQDAFVYLTETNPRFGRTFARLLDHNNFNNRDFEYERRADEHLLVHFTGARKEKSKKSFCRRLGLNEYVVPEELLRGFRVASTE